MEKRISTEYKIYVLIYCSIGMFLSLQAMESPQQNNTLESYVDFKRQNDSGYGDELIEPFREKWSIAHPSVEEDFLASAFQDTIDEDVKSDTQYSNVYPMNSGSYFRNKSYNQLSVFQEKSSDNIYDKHILIELKLLQYIFINYLHNKYSSTDWFEKVFEKPFLQKDQVVWDVFAEVFPPFSGIMTFQGKQNIFFLRHYDRITFLLTYPAYVEKDTYIDIMTNNALVKAAVQNPEMLVKYEHAFSILDEWADF